MRSAVNQGQNQNENQSDLGVIPHLSLAFTQGRHHSLIGCEGNDPSCSHSLIRGQSPQLHTGDLIPLHQSTEILKLSYDESLK